MSAPALPDIFGNYALGDFVEVVSPAAISWLPQTSGWGWLGAIALLLLARRGWRWLRLWYKNRYRREALQRLQVLSQTPVENASLVDLNRLLKLTALAAFPRIRVARLSGARWVAFLNDQCDSQPFSQKLGDLLALQTYRSTALLDTHWQQLLAASLTWVQTHENSHHV